MGHKILFPLQGIVTVLNTPFDQGGEIDFTALLRNAEYALQSGVSGFLVPGMAAEADRLTHAEKLKMVETVMKAAGGRVPVIAGTMGDNPSDSKKLTKDYLSMGCGNVLVNIPYTSRETYVKYVTELAETGPEMIMIQDWDSRGYGLPDELIVELFQSIDPFRCLKIETIPAGIKYSRILELTNHKLNISGGWAVTQMIEGLQRGVHAFMPTGMHSIYVSIYQLWKAGEKREAEELFLKILPVIAFSNQHLDISIRFFKRLLWRQGIYPTADVRGERIPFDAFHIANADRQIDRVIQLEEQLKAMGSSRNATHPLKQADDAVI